MNPDKLFDYLDGKLSPADRTALEEKLMSDAQLRAQFHIAREIHRGGGKSREVVVPGDDPIATERAGRLGRRIAVGAIVLVFANVFIGLAVIAAKSKKPAAADARETEIRRQLAASLGAAAQNALPPPSFAAAEISLNAPRAEWESVAGRVIAASEKFGGSAVKGLPDDNVMTVVADLPSNREADFRQALAPSPVLAPAPAPAASTTSPNERTIVQVRIAEAAR